MLRFDRLTMFTSDAPHRVAGVFRAVQSQPGWVSRAALLVFVLIIGLPILLLVMLAVLASVIVFGVLAIANWITGRFRGLMPRNDGRANVRVIHRVE